MRVSAALIVAAVIAGHAPVSAQSLADAARAAAARRQDAAGRPAPRVITDKDLPTVPPTAAPPPPAASSTGAAPASAPSAPAAGSAAAAVPRPPDEQAWKERMRPLQERLARHRAEAADSKRRADALGRAADRCLRVGVVCGEYGESLRVLEQHRAVLEDIVRDEQAIFALQEEGRRAGVPPGWLRP